MTDAARLHAPASRLATLVTCEHGGNRVPAEWRAIFAGHEALLASHRGWDPGALEMARDLAAALDAPLLWSEVTRLLADLNRSAHHRSLFSEVTRGLPAAERTRILDAHWRPWRDAVMARVAEAVEAGGTVLHLSSHSFTPVLDGVTRPLEVGLLYDPSRPGERKLCLAWQAALREAGHWRVRLNQPYRGRADGLATALRRLHGPACYVGIELELNQGVVADAEAWPALRRDVRDTLVRALREVGLAGVGTSAATADQASGSPSASSSASARSISASPPHSDGGISSPQNP